VQRAVGALDKVSNVAPVAEALALMQRNSGIDRYILEPPSHNLSVAADGGDERL
jgi:hypothetical protein